MVVFKLPNVLPALKGCRRRRKKVWIVLVIVSLLIRNFRFVNHQDKALQGYVVDQFWTIFYNATMTTAMLDVSTTTAAANSSSLLNDGGDNNNNNQTTRTTPALNTTTTKELEKQQLRATALERTAFAYPLESWKVSLQDSDSLQQLPLNLSIFVYNESNLPHKVTAIRACRNRQLLELPKPSFQNYHVDLALLQLFETTPYRTLNASEANLFVVPYLHGSHCMTSSCTQFDKKYGNHCRRIPDKTIDEMLQSLDYYPKFRDRHVFLLSADRKLLKHSLEAMPLTLTIGPKNWTHNKYGPKYNPNNRDGAIVVPFLNDHPQFQPHWYYQERREDWWTRPRKYSFVYFYGNSNNKQDRPNHPRRFRKHFIQSIQKKQQLSTNQLGGLPFKLMAIDKSWSPDAIYDYYKDSVFCPCLPGDAPTQKRYYDVILSGCIPVVMKFPNVIPPHFQNDSQWHPFRGIVENVFPFSKGSTIQWKVHDNDDDYDNTTVQPIDYKSFVVQATIPPKSMHGKGIVEQAMEQVLQNPDDLRRRQLAMMKYAPLLSYGMGPDAHKYPDAFSQVLKSLNTYVKELDKEEAKA